MTTQEDEEEIKKALSNGTIEDVLSKIMSKKGVSIYYGKTLGEHKNNNFLYLKNYFNLQVIS